MVQRRFGLSLRRLAAIVFAASLSGCMVGPDYLRPEEPTPSAWSVPQEDGLTSDRGEAELLARWWTALGDPLLTDLVERAVAHNLDLHEAQARVREARARRAIARAGLLPDIGAGASATRSRESEEAFGGTDRNRSLYDAGFDASWEIDLFGGLRREVEAATADLQASEEDLRDVLVSLIAEVALAYVELRSLQARLAIAEANLSVQSETFEIAGWRSEAGLTTSLDVEQARADLEETRAQIPSLLGGIVSSKNRLSVLIGEPPGSLGILDEPRPIPVAAVEIAVGVPAETLLRRPDVRRAERSLAAETARVGVATAAAYPRVTLNGSIGLEAMKAANLFSASAVAGSIAARLTQTILDFGRVGGGIRAQDAVREQALARFTSSVLLALEEVENAMVAFVREQERRRALGEAAGAAERATALSRDQYQSGLVDFETVLVAQRSLFSLQDQLAASEREVTANLIRLYKALGGGWTPGGEA